MSKTLTEFKSVTIFIMTYNETNLLRETISVIKGSDCFSDVDRIVVVAKNDSCDGFFEAKKLIEEDCTGKVDIYLQKADTIEDSFTELPPMAEGSHFVIMAADMETNPANISDFIKMAKIYPEAIICAAKWLKDSSVEGYGRLHELGSRMMNMFVGLLFNRNIKDPFSIYQIYPLSVYKKLSFDESSGFVYEHTIKALHNNFEYMEIPTVYRKRPVGRSHVSNIKMVRLAMAFCFTAIKVRFSKKIS